MYINKNLLSYYPRYMHLRLFVDGSNDLKLKYTEAIHNHNGKLYSNPIHIDAGFDLYAPALQEMTSSTINKLDHLIKCSAQIVEDNGNTIYNTGYYLHPRSSISKTPLRLANSTGIVDSGYRGHLMGMMDCLISSYSVIKYDRLVQICAPGLMPIFVELVENEEELGAPTLRGEGGIGSTGR
jgi:dUTP pyrophosphatase